MTSVGAILKDRRKELNLSTADIEHMTKISVKYLQAIEADEFYKIPGKAYARGFIDLYAQAVGLDGALLVGQYKRETGDEPREDPIEAPEPHEILVRDVVKKARSLWLPLAIAAGLILIVVASFGWLRSTPQAKTPSPKPIVLPKDTTPDKDKKSESTAKETQPAASPSAAASSVDVKIKIISEDCWIDVIKVDGQEEFAGTLKVGETKEYKASKSIYIKAPWGHRISVVFNGKDLGPLNSGSPVSVTFTQEGPKEGEVQPSP